MNDEVNSIKELALFDLEIIGQGKLVT